MKVLGVIAYWLCFASAVQAHLSVADLTPCGLSCTVQSIEAVGCSIADLTCQCTNKELSQESAECMLANCTMHDSLVVAKVQASICNFRFEDKSGLVISVFIAVTTIATVLIVARVLSKGLGRDALGFEDWIIVAALLLAVPAITFTIIMSNEGFGKHLYSLRDGALLKILRSFYIAENIYVVDLAITKLSILVFYLRIFQHNSWFRTAVFTTMALISLSSTIISVLTIFQCHPVSYFWDKNIKGGVCLNLNSLAYANTAMSMIQDVIIVVLPIPVVSKMNMDRRKKLGVSFMFGLGGFGCIVSGIRLRSLLGFGNSIDPSWDFVYVVIWTALELAVAIVCSCLPELRKLLVRIYPRDFVLSFGSRRVGSKRVNGSSFSSVHKAGGILNRRKDFIELDDDITKITIAGEEIEYPRKPPPVPRKEINRGLDGKFYES